MRRMASGDNSSECCGCFSISRSRSIWRPRWVFVSEVLERGGHQGVSLADRTRPWVSDRGWGQKTSAIAVICRQIIINQDWPSDSVSIQNRQGALLLWEDWDDRSKFQT
jgi:hypothetical protein